MNQRYWAFLTATLSLVALPFVTNVVSGLVQPQGRDALWWAAVFPVLAVACTALATRPLRQEASTNLGALQANWDLGSAVVFDGGRQRRPGGLIVAAIVLSYIGLTWLGAESAGTGVPREDWTWKWYQTPPPDAPSNADMNPFAVRGSLILAIIVCLHLGLAWWYGKHRGKVIVSTEGIAFVRGRLTLAAPWSELESAAVLSSWWNGVRLVARPKPGSPLILQHPMSAAYDAKNGYFVLCDLALAGILPHAVTAAIARFAAPGVTYK